MSELVHRAELYLCIARAFLPPSSEESFDGLRNLLSDDLEELGRELEYDLSGVIGAYRTAVQAIPDHAALLREYSRLFLAPPLPVNINTGVYLDGGIAGDAVLALDALYRQHGVQRSDEFHDLSDHITVQLEFLAYLLASAASVADAGDKARAEALVQAAADLRDRYIRNWLPRFTQALEKAVRAGGQSSPYLALARVLQQAVEQDAARYAHRVEGVEVSSGTAGVLSEEEKAALRARYQNIDMDEIRAKLQEHGLSTEHLEVPREQRMSRMQAAKPPKPPGRKG
jgi:putative dimethyl sulfoxide reductase chaperone